MGGRTEDGSAPPIGAIVWVRGETLKAERETADLWQPKMEWESDSLCSNSTYPSQSSGWGLELNRDCGAIPGRGLPLTAERWGMWGRRSWWEMPVEESRAAMEARWHCWVTHRVWSHHHSLSAHASIGSWTIERLAHQTPDALNYSVGPHPGCLVKCLTPWSTE